MSGIIGTSVESFTHTQWNLFRDQQGEIVSISSLEECSGESYLLTHNQLNGVYSQVRFAETELGQWWTHFADNEFELFPQIHDMGSCGALHYCITDIPDAEQIQSYISRHGAIPPVAAVALIRKFVRSMEQQPLKLHASIALEPRSIWIGRTKSEPQLCFGEIRGLDHPNPIEPNIRLFVDLLGFMTDRCDDPAFVDLCKKLVQSTNFLEVDKTLSEFLPQTTSCYLSDSSKPASLRDRITDHYNTTTSVAESKSFDLTEIAKKAVWPVAFALIVTLLLVFNSTSLPSKIIEAQNSSNGDVIEAKESHTEYLEFSSSAAIPEE